MTNAAAPLKRPSEETRVEFQDNRILIDLCGQFDENLSRLEQGFGVSIMRRGNLIFVHGPEESRAAAESALNSLYDRLQSGRGLERGDLDALIRVGRFPSESTVEDSGGDSADNSRHQTDMFPGGRLEIRTRKKTVEPRSTAQRTYAMELFRKELVFGIGPAGTGKTYLAVAAAVSMFLEGGVDRIVLSRPAVEAGERLGFLPGTERDKMDPYLRPLYDALDDMLPHRQVDKLMEEKRIEIAPLAFMRGRTLANAFIVLDEAQNATTMQMKMFLTRMGEGSRMAVTGDPSQIDLPRGTASGLVEALEILDGVDGIGTVRFNADDVVRHAIVARVIRAYDQARGNGRDASKRTESRRNDEERKA